MHVLYLLPSGEWPIKVFRFVKQRLSTLRRRRGVCWRPLPAAAAASIQLAPGDAQVAVIEYARNVLGKAEANSTEFDAGCPEAAVVFMPEGSRTHMGGTMRLGARATRLVTGDCHAARLYRPDDALVHERHRHRCASRDAIVLLMSAAQFRIQSSTKVDSQAVFLSTRLGRPSRC